MQQKQSRTILRNPGAPPGVDLRRGPRSPAQAAAGAFFVITLAICEPRHRDLFAPCRRDVELLGRLGNGSLLVRCSSVYMVTSRSEATLENRSCRSRGCRGNQFRELSATDNLRGWLGCHSGRERNRSSGWSTSGRSRRGRRFDFGGCGPWPAGTDDRLYFRHCLVALRSSP